MSVMTMSVRSFKELCEGVRNVTYERLVFNQRNQK